MHDNELPGVRDEGIEAEARKQATAAGSGDAAGSWRMEVLAALPDELQTVVRPAATSAVRDRLVAAAALREEPAWLQAAPKWRAVSRWLLCSATVPENDDRVKDIELPRGMQDGVTAILGGLDRRGGGWVDPADAPAPEPEPFETAADWAGPWPDREWLIGGWLPVGRVGMFGGRGGRGKSRLALQLAARLAADPPGVGAFLPPLQTDTWGSRAVGEAGLEIDPSHAGPVVFASWEDEQAEFGRRLEAMATAGLVGPAACLGRLHYIDMRRKGPVWAPASAGSRHILTAAELTAAGASLRATCEQQGAVLLILDSLAGAYASDENQRGLVRSFLSSWDEWGSRQRCAVMLIAHPPKGNSGDRSGEDDDFAGSGDWHAGARWRWVLAPAPTGYTRPVTDTRENEKAVPIKAPRLSLAKASYGPDGAGVFVMSDSLGWRGVSAEAAAHGAVPAGTTVVQVGGRNAEAEDEFTIR